MATRLVDGFELEKAVVLCSECQAPFATEMLVSSRRLNSSDIVEADLHRVFSDAQIRAALLACCPACNYCAWSSSFKPFKLKAELMRNESKIEPSKKYALAVKWARQKRVHSLDVAFIALNGLWCTREAGEPDDLWLELAIYEHEKGMAASPSCPQDDGMTHLIMAELYRQHRNFDKALQHYALADKDQTVSKEILHHQTLLAQRGAYGVTALPLKITRLYFEVDDSPAADSTAVMDFEPPKESEVQTAGVSPSTNPASSNPTGASFQPASPEQVSEATTSAAASTTAFPSSSAASEPGTSPLLAAISSLFSGGSSSLLSNYAGSDDDVTQVDQESKPMEGAGHIQSLAEELTKAAVETPVLTSSQAGTVPAQNTSSTVAAAPAPLQNATGSAAGVPLVAASFDAAPGVNAKESPSTFDAARAVAATTTVQERKSTAFDASPESKATATNSAFAPAAKSGSVPTAEASAAVAAVTAQANVSAAPVSTTATSAASTASTFTPTVSSVQATAGRAQARASSAPAAASIPSPNANTNSPAPIAPRTVTPSKFTPEEVIPPLAVSPDPTVKTRTRTTLHQQNATPPAPKAAPVNAQAPAALKQAESPRSRASVITAPQASSVSVSLSVTSVSTADVVTEKSPSAASANSSASASTSAPAKKSKAKRVKPPRDDFHFARRPVMANIAPNRNGWVNDYGNHLSGAASHAPSQSLREEKVESMQRPAEQVSPQEPKQEVHYANDGNSRQAAAAATLDAAAAEVGAPLPGLAIDDSVKGKDYSDAINRVESYLSFSRRVYSRNWMKL